MSTLRQEIGRRRTFAIISHPDAGKTTLTEKFLLYGGAIAQAGAVKGKNEYLPVYTIVPDTLNPNTGTIKVNNGLSCRYCLNKNIKALTGTTASASAATKTMFYGNPQTAEMALFGDTTIEDNDGYKFGEGLITILGETSADIGVTTWHGFSVVNLPKSGS